MTNKEKILKMYHDGVSALDMAKQLNCTRQNIYHALKTCNLSTKDRYRKKTYGDAIRTDVVRLRGIWSAMKKRCLDQKSDGYKNYGMRGILIYEEWLVFSNFLRWAINNNYAHNKQIDRIDNNSNYCPENCRWVTPAENCQNTRLTKLTKSMVIAARISKTANIMTVTEMSKFLNVERTVVGNAVSGKTWKNIYP